MEHGFDMGYALGRKRRNYTGNERLMDEIYSELFVNFTKHGNPSPRLFSLLY